MISEKFLQKYGNVTEEYKFYDGEETLRYDPVKHVYYRVSEDGLEVLEGVSTVSHIVDKSDILIPWACKMMAQAILLSPGIPEDRAAFEKLVLGSKSAHKDKLEDAGNIGKQAHEWIENYIRKQLGLAYVLNTPTDERVMSACAAALDWMQKHNVRWLSTEQKVYSRLYRYAGTMDGRCLTDSCSDPNCCPISFKDKKTLADWKTSNYLYIEFILQTGAYKKAYEEETGDLLDDIWVIRLGKEDGEFDPWHLTPLMIELGQRAFLSALSLSRDMADLKDEMAYIKDQARAAERAIKAAAKAEALKLKCANADKYKGIRVPQCNGGNPCKACLDKYNAVHEKTLDKSEEV